MVGGASLDPDDFARLVQRVIAFSDARPQPGLLALVDPRTSEVRGVRGRVGDIKTHPVNRDQPPSGQPHTRRLLAADRLGDPLKQRGQRLRSQAGPGLKDRGLARRAVRLLPTRGPRETIGQLAQHVLIGALGVQRHPDREVRHHPGRQRPIPLLGPPEVGDHLIDQVRREHLGQHPHRHQIRQPTIRLRLLPSSSRHATKLHRCNLN